MPRYVIVLSKQQQCFCTCRYFWPSFDKMVGSAQQQYVAHYLFVPRTGRKFFTTLQNEAFRLVNPMRGVTNCTINSTAVLR